MSSHSLTPVEKAAYFETRQPAVYGVCAVLLILGNAAVPLRIWAQWRVHHKPLMEDYFLATALVSLWYDYVLLGMLTDIDMCQYRDDYNDDSNNLRIRAPHLARRGAGPEP